MAKVKVKFRNSTVEGKAGVIYYQLCHKCQSRQITTGIRLFPEQWDALRERAVVYVHALKNAMNQIITQLGISIAHLLGGAIVMENVFNIPGLGRLAFDSIVRRDYPVIQAHILYVAFIYVIVNLVVDLLYKFFDPRIEYK